MKKYIYLLFIIFFTWLNLPAKADSNLAKNLSGLILLQVEDNGEAWYVNPADKNRYYLGRPNDAFEIMRYFGLGITDDDLAKIPIGIIKNNKKDSDNDGLDDTLEEALGTDPSSPDSDNDGYNDKLEIENSYNPLAEGKINIDNDLIKNNLGKIFLAVQNRGEAWYLEPKEGKRYFLGSPDQAFNIMRNLGLGISNQDISEISLGLISSETSGNQTDDNNINDDKFDSEYVFQTAAKAIMAGEKNKALEYFTADMKPVVEQTMDTLNSDGKFSLGNLMLGAQLTFSNDKAITYSTEVYWQGDKVPIYYDLVKQDNGEWLLDSL